MKTPDQLTQAQLVAFSTQIQEWMYAENGEWNPSKEVGGADTVETVEYWLGQYGLTPIEEEGIPAYVPIEERLQETPAPAPPTAEQVQALRGKYADVGVSVDLVDDDDYPLSDWQYEVANGDTKRGYVHWVLSNREQDEDGESMA